MRTIQEAREIIGFIVRQLLLLLGFVVVASLAPVILAVLPQALLFLNPHSNLFGLGQLFIWGTPMTVAFWMAALCHFHSIRLWLRKGEGNTGWEEAHGGFWRTNFKASRFMVLGLFGAIFCEILFLAAFKYVPYAAFDGASRQQLWFALFPFAAFAPVLLLLFKRRDYSESC